MTITKFESLTSKLIKYGDQFVLLDSDVAELYGVETKRINEAVKNNPDKFPKTYIIALSEKEWRDLKSKISTSNWGFAKVSRSVKRIKK